MLRMEFDFDRSTPFHCLAMVRVPHEAQPSPHIDKGAGAAWRDWRERHWVER